MPSTCWNTPWTPQKHPPARTATSDVAGGFAGSSNTGGGSERALSAAEGKTDQVTMTAASSSAAKIKAGETTWDVRGTHSLLKSGLRRNRLPHAAHTALRER